MAAAVPWLQPQWVILGYGLTVLGSAISEFAIQKEGNMLNILLDAAGWFGLVCFPLHFFYPWLAICCTVVALIPVALMFGITFTRRRDISSVFMVLVSLLTLLLLTAALVRDIQDTNAKALPHAAPVAPLTHDDILAEADV
eukprot:EG_transcript_42234